MYKFLHLTDDKNSTYDTIPDATVRGSVINELCNMAAPCRRRNNEQHHS